MAHIHRLIGVLLFFALSPSWALFPASGGQQYSATYNGYTSGWLSSAAAACASVASQNSTGGFSFTVTASTESSCSFSFTYNGQGPYTAQGTSVERRNVALSCPSNSTLSGTTCSCNSGYVEDGNSCIPAPVNNCADITMTPTGEYTGVGSTGTYLLCDTAGIASSGDPSKPGCSVEITADFSATTGGVTRWSGKGRFTGAKCAVGTPDSNNQTTPPTSPENGEPNPCSSGQVPGTINGSTICYKPSSGTQTGPTETSTTPSSGGGGPGSAPPGSTSSETSTTCSGDQCTTTTTWRGSDGSVTGTTTKTESKNDFCQDNPKSLMCIQSSWAGGSCDSVPACDGDPVFCAIAQSDFKTKCALNPDPGPESELYHSEKSKTGSVIGDLPGSGTATIGAGSFDQSERFSASGLTDLQIVVAGKPFTVELSRLNTFLVWMGNLLVAVSFLGAMAIVFKGQS